MRSRSLRNRIAPALALGALGFGLLATAAAQAQAQESAKTKAKPAPAEDVAQTPKKGTPYKSLAELDAAYETQAAELERGRIADLAALADNQSGAEAEATYHRLFRMAIARDRYEAAAKAAAAYLADAPEPQKGKDQPKRDPELRGLATFVDAVHKINREQYPQALKEIDRFLKSTKAGEKEKVDPNTIYAVGEALLQRLVRAGRYDVAKQACELFIQDDADPAVKAHFAARLARVNLLGKVAPPIAASDVDGTKVSLADLKGKVVLVDFWATWCPPCVAEIPTYRGLTDQYGPKGFEILAVNLDSAREGSKNAAKDAAKTHSAVRQFLVEFGVPWTVVFNGTGDSDFAKAYGVSDLPTNFLVGRDGKVIQVEQFGSELEKAIAQAVDGDEKPEKGASDEKSKK